MGRKRKGGEAEAAEAAVAVEGPPAWFRYSQLCRVCGTSFTVNVPGAHGELTRPLTCPVCGTACPR